MSATSPIDDLREQREMWRRRHSAAEGQVVFGCLIETIDRILGADISISWMDGDVRVDRYHGTHCPQLPDPEVDPDAKFDEVVDETARRRAEDGLLALSQVARCGPLPEDVSTDQPPALAIQCQQLRERVHKLEAMAADPLPEEEAELDAAGACGGPEVVADLHGHGYAVSFIRQMSRWERQALLMHLELVDRVRQVESCAAVEGDI